MEPEPKKKREMISVACDECRRTKVKCNGDLPCLRCSKFGLLCAFTPGKKRGPPSQSDSYATPSSAQVSIASIVDPEPAPSSLKLEVIGEDGKESILLERRKIATPVRPSSIGNPRKETTMVTTYTMNNYMDLHFTRLSLLWNEPGDFFRSIMKNDTKPGKLQLFSLLSLYFRNDGNVSASDKFLQYALSLSRDLFDDHDSQTSFHSGLGFSMLSYALGANDRQKAKHYARISSNLMDNLVLTDTKHQMIKQVFQATNKQLYDRPTGVRPELTETLQEFVAISRSGTPASPPSSSSSSSSTPSPPSLSPSAYSYLSPPGAPMVSFPDFYPSLSASSIQSNGIFQMFVKKYPDLFAQTKHTVQNHLEISIMQKFFSLECFNFAREIILNYLPMLNTMLGTLTEEHTKVPENSIPLQVALPLLGFIDFTDTLLKDFPEIDQIRGVESDFFRCLIFQAIDDEQNATIVARRLIASSREKAFSTDLSPVMKIVYPAFVACCCLYRYGCILDAEPGLTTIQKFVPLFTQAKDAYELLLEVKKRAQILPSNRHPQPPAAQQGQQQQQQSQPPQPALQQSPLQPPLQQSPLSQHSPPTHPPPLLQPRPLQPYPLQSIPQPFLYQQLHHQQQLQQQLQQQQLHFQLQQQQQQPHQHQHQHQQQQQQQQPRPFQQQQQWPPQFLQPGFPYQPPQFQRQPATPVITELSQSVTYTFSGSIKTEQVPPDSQFQYPPPVSEYPEPQFSPFMPEMAYLGNPAQFWPPELQGEFTFPPQERGSQKGGQGAQGNQQSSGASIEELSSEF